MDIYCINLFCDDRDMDIKPWHEDANDHRITMEDKTILREMWKMHRSMEDRNNPSNKTHKGKVKHVNRNTEDDIKQKLTSLGYGLRSKKREK